MIDNTRTGQAPTHEEVAMRAYYIWEQEGKPQGRDVEIWKLAERELTVVHRQEDHALRNWEKSRGIRAKRQRARW
jgi:hypothetical protein